VGVPFVNRRYDKQRQGLAFGIYGMGMSGTVIATVTAPKIAEHWSLATPCWVAAALMAAMTVIFSLVARDAPTGRRPARGCRSPSLLAFSSATLGL
jgi:MFS transporter, NNP family, nitrate/nitrite transporter